MDTRRWTIESNDPDYIAYDGSSYVDGPAANEPVEVAPLELLAKAIELIEGLADQQAMYDGWFEEPLAELRAVVYPSEV